MNETRTVIDTGVAVSAVLLPRGIAIITTQAVLASFLKGGA